MCGTELACGATRCAVLSWRMELPGSVHEQPAARALVAHGQVCHVTPPEKEKKKEKLHLNPELRKDCSSVCTTIFFWPFALYFAVAELRLVPQGYLRDPEVILASQHPSKLRRTFQGAAPSAFKTPPAVPAKGVLKLSDGDEVVLLTRAAHID
eukprot:1765435-Rhodomonas_salina.3